LSYRDENSASSFYDNEIAPMRKRRERTVQPADIDHESLRICRCKRRHRIIESDWAYICDYAGEVSSAMKKLRIVCSDPGFDRLHGDHIYIAGLEPRNQCGTNNSFTDRGVGTSYAETNHVMSRKRAMTS
jgi:hypothetical protein